ncbi:MAG: thymidine phosphorylase [Chromatiales bacterium]|nr:MAG: thymidine phosphorylase [Chromatiales bacterium]
MLFTDVIRKKRDGGELDDAEIQFFVDGLADESLPAEQVSALAMAVFLNSMSFDEAAKLTLAMAASGTVLDWNPDIYDAPIVDKHSTGGVGDKVSFLLAPILAACGCYVPMISGRGLGHTGGTTDKAESIPGYNATPDLDTFREVVRDVKCAIIGQTPDLAPADRRFYSIRDVTSTVESVPLITASILSKKIAAGLQGLVMDVKVGSGAFMESLDKARELATSIIGTAGRAGLKTHAVITDMNEVLGSTAGNALEIEESIRFLRNEVREPRLNEVTIALCAQMLLVSGQATDRADAVTRCEEAVSSGRAAEKFAAMVEDLGGPGDLLENYQGYLPKAPFVRPVMAQGIVRAVNTRAVGNAIIELGGGRREVGQALDLSVGFSDIAATGTELDGDTPLAVIHAASEDDAAIAEGNLLAAVSLGDAAPAERPVVYEILTG